MNATSRPAVARRVTLALLLAPTLIALALLAWATLSHRPRPVRTEDALLDEFLQAVADSKAASNVGWISLSAYKEALPQALWRKWEQQYGTDPRYWMLCYYFRPHNDAYGAADVEANEPDVSYLYEARKRGCADWEVLFKLLRVEQSAWSLEARQALALPDPRRNAPPEERQRFYAQLWNEQIARHGAELAQLRAEALRAGAGQAQVHYYLASLAAQRGEMAEAFAELDLGNAAPHNEMGSGVPFSDLDSAARQGQPLAGDHLLSGLFDRERWGTRYWIYQQFKSGFKAMAEHALVQRNLAALQSLHLACCRFGTSSGAAYLQASVALQVDDTVLKNMNALLPPTASAQTQAVAEAQRQRGQLYATIKAIAAANYSLPDWPSWCERLVEQCPAVSCGQRYINLEELERENCEYLQVQSVLAGPVKQQFEELSAQDFTR